VCVVEIMGWSMKNVAFEFNEIVLIDVLHLNDQRFMNTIQIISKRQRHCFISTTTTTALITIYIYISMSDEEIDLYPETRVFTYRLL